MEIKITKTIKIEEINNDKCHNYYYLVHCRIYNDTKTMYKKYKFVVWFDIFDLQEYYEKDNITEYYIKDYVYEYGYGIIENKVTDYNNTKEFYNYCIDTINDYNDRW